MIYQFGDFELDENNYTLSRQGTPLHVEPQTFDLLRYLLSRAGEILSRDILMEAVWNGRIVSDATISGSIKAARKVLGDSGDKQSYIQTVRGRGIRFVALVNTPVKENSVTDPATQNIPTPPASLPALIVLPFDTFDSSDHSDGEISDLASGLVENLTTVLTRIPLLRIVARSTSFALKGKPVNAAELRKQFSVDFILEGSLQLIDKNIRTNVQLIDAKGGFHLWAKRFDSVPDKEIVDRLLNEVVSVLEPQLVRGILDHVRTGNGEPGGKQLLLQSMSLLSLRGWHKDTFEESAILLESAVEKEPELALAHAYLSLILGLGHRVGLLEKSREITERAEQQAELALRLDSYDSTVVSLAGCALADIGQPDRAIPILENAIELNASNGHAWAALGSAETLLGKFDIAIAHLRKGIDISPADSRRAVWCAILSVALLSAGHPTEATAAAKEGIKHDPDNYLPRVMLAGSYLSQRLTGEATKAMKGAFKAKSDLARNEVDGLVGSKVGAILWRLSSR